MSEEVNLYIEIIRDTAKLPFYAHEGDAGMDVCAAEDILLPPGATIPVPTGLILHIPRSYEVQVRPRSGLSLKTRLRLPNSPGTIDSGYKDELMVLVHNSSYADCVAGEQLFCTEKDNRQGSYLIKTGDRIAQIVLAPVTRARVLAADDAAAYHNSVENRGGGFGHSGIGTEG